MSRLFALSIVLLLAFSIGAAYAFSGGSGNTGSSGSRDADSVGASDDSAPPVPPAASTSASDDSVREKEREKAREKEREKSRDSTDDSKKRPAAISAARKTFKIRERVLECGDEETVKERVKCRMKLKVAATDGLRHVPEECRDDDDDSEQKECFELYDKVQPCRNLSTNDEKFACVRQKIGKTGNITSEYRGCQASQNPTACMALAKENAHYLAKFRIYNLENEAEKLVLRGVSEETVADFITKLEQRKSEFNSAATKEGKQTALRAAKADWQEFKKKAVDEVKKQRRRSASAS